MATPTTRETKEAPGGGPATVEPQRVVEARSQFDALCYLVLELAARPDKTLIMHYSAAEILPTTFDAFETVTRTAGRRYIRMQQCHDCVLFIIYPIDTTEETAIEVADGGTVTAGNATGESVVTDADVSEAQRRVLGIVNALPHN